MRIWFQKHTVLGRFPWLDAAYEAHFSRLVRPDTEVTQNGLPATAFPESLPAAYVRYGQLEALFAWEFARQAVKAQDAGYDAVVIGTSQDPGYRTCQGLVSLPVVSYGAATYMLLAGQQLQFGVVGFIPELEAAIRPNLDAAGVGAQCVGFSYLEDGRTIISRALTNDGDTAQLVPAMEECARRLKRRGADAIVCGEGLENELLWAAGIREIAGLPVIDSNGFAVLYAETLAMARERGVWASGRESYGQRRVDDATFAALRHVLM